MTTLLKIYGNQAVQPGQNSAIFLNYMADNRKTCPKNVRINNTNNQEASLAPQVLPFLKYSS